MCTSYGRKCDLSSEKNEVEVKVKVKVKVEAKVERKQA